MDKLLKAMDVAALLNLKRSTVYDLARRGLIPYVILATGKRRSLIRFRREDIERLIEERSRPATTNRT